MVELFANNGDPDQTLYSASSDLCLHCSPGTILGVSSLQWVKLCCFCYCCFFFFCSINLLLDFYHGSSMKLTFRLSITGQRVRCVYFYKCTLVMLPYVYLVLALRRIV